MAGNPGNNPAGLAARTDLLRKRAVSFCNAFLEGVSPQELLDKHFVPDDNGGDARAAVTAATAAAAAAAAAAYRPKITEHGPSWAAIASRLPFLGVTFAGRRHASPPSPPLPLSNSGDGGGEGARTDIGSGASTKQKLETAEEEEKEGQKEGGKEEEENEKEEKEEKGQQQRGIGGGQTCDDYFARLGQTLKPRPGSLRFPAPQQFLVNALAAGGEGDADDGSGQGNSGRGGVVMVTGKAVWASVRTDKAWEEDFVFRLSEFDDEGRIGHWEIWADPLSAWLAVGD